MLIFSLSSKVSDVNASSLLFYGSDFSIYIPTDYEIGFQDSPATGFYVFINVTSGNLNSSVNVIGLYDNQFGYFTLTQLENCNIHMYSTGETAIFRRNNVVFSGDTAINLGETVTLSWNFPVYHTVTLRDGVHGTTTPLGTFTEPAGTVIVITATPESTNYYFLYWQVLNSLRIGPNPYNLVVSRDMDISPVFKHVSGSETVNIVSYIFPFVILIGVVGFAIVIIKSRKN